MDLTPAAHDSRERNSHANGDVGDSGGGIVVMESREPVVSLSGARADLLAGLRGRRPVLVTGPGSKLTRPLHDLVQAAGGAWVVRQDGGAMSDGVTGLPVARPQDAVTGGGRAGRLEAASSDTSLLTTHGATDGLVQVLRLEIAVRSSLQSRGLGRTAARAVEHLTGREPAGWGTAEPALEQWDDEAIYLYAERRSPRPTYVVVAGRGVVGSLLIRRTGQGIEELSTLDIALGPAGADAVAEAERRARDFLDWLPAQPIVNHAMTSTFAGRADLLIAPASGATAAPLHLVIGAPTLREREVPLDEAVGRFGAERQARGRMVALRFPLAGNGAGSGWERAREIARWVGGTDEGSRPV
ncbi:DUF6177 family protein [Myceligenerans crystallogenes]|uniref:N-acetyltransferase domain-containing protein n=1 Tax=Myceligenerans crystallogenes TaxID=316335 RepID=A0ABN2NBP7_9MICO